MDKASSLLRSMPFRLALALVVLFSFVSLLGLVASYAVTSNSLDQAMREDLRQDMAGFRAAPSATAVAALVDAEGRETDPDRLVLSYVARNGQQFGNTAFSRDAEGYHLVSIAQNNPRITGSYLSLSETLFGGQLTIARNRAEIEALRDVYLAILAWSLLPTILIALSGGLYLARSTVGWSHDLSQIGRKVDQMAQAQETSVATLRQVSTDIAHDLKTPIQRVAVHLDDLLTRNNLPKEAQGLVEDAKAQLDGIASVFHSLLQIAQIESGTPKSRFQSVDLVALCQTFFEIYEPAAQDKGKTLRFAAPQDGTYFVTGDRNLLGQLLSNLIENALVHTLEGSVVDIELTHSLGQIVLSVSDDGPGIPQDERALVLRRLYRLDRSRTTPGSGLGLSLVRVIAQLHNALLELRDNDPGLRVDLRFDGAAS
jgi:signal transduction histidine kinase